MDIVLYSTHCPKCSVLEKKLEQKGINFTLVDDNAEVVKFAKEHKIMSAPILKVGNAVFTFTDANNWLNDVTVSTSTEEPETQSHTLLNGELIDTKCDEECKF